MLNITLILLDATIALWAAFPLALTLGSVWLFHLAYKELKTPTDNLRWLNACRIVCVVTGLMALVGLSSLIYTIYWGYQQGGSLF